MYYYAVFDPLFKKVFAIDQTEYKMEGTDRVEISSYDPSIIGKIYNPETGAFEVPEFINVEVNITGGDGMTPRGISIDDPDGLTISFALFYNGQQAPIDGLWRISIRDINGNVVDVIRVNVNQGSGSVVFKPLQTGILVIRDNDFEPISLPDGKTLPVKLEQPITIKVYR